MTTPLNRQKLQQMKPYSFTGYKRDAGPAKSRPNGPDDVRPVSQIYVPTYGDATLWLRPLTGQVVSEPDQHSTFNFKDVKLHNDRALRIMTQRKRRCLSVQTAPWDRHIAQNDFACAVENHFMHPDHFDKPAQPVELAHAANGPIPAHQIWKSPVSIEFI